MEAYQNAALSPEERAKDLLGKMTLQEKVGQLNQRLYGFRIYERQGEEFTLTEEFKEEVERMGGLGVLYGLYRADPWADKDEKTGIVLELSAKAYNIVQKYVIDHSRLGIPMMMSTECPHGHQALVHSHQRTLEHLERERARRRNIRPGTSFRRLQGMRKTVKERSCGSGADVGARYGARPEMGKK